MSLLPENATFEERVQECFLAFRGSGLMISALDAEVLHHWCSTGVPYEVVARGIRKAAERAAHDLPPGAPLLRSLRACARPVEAEIKAWQSRATGRGAAVGEETGAEKSEPFELSRHRKLRAALKNLGLARPDLVAVTDGLLSGILSRPVQQWSELEGRGVRVTAALLRGMGFAERREALREARGRMGTVGLSSRARRMALRFHRSQTLQQRLALPGLE